MEEKLKVISFCQKYFINGRRPRSCKSVNVSTPGRSFPIPIPDGSFLLIKIISREWSARDIFYRREIKGDFSLSKIVHKR